MRLATHKLPSLEAPNVRTHTSPVHLDAQNGLEPLGRLATLDVKPAKEVKRAERSTGYSLPSTAKQKEPGIQENKKSQDETKTDTLKTLVNNRETINPEHINTPKQKPSNFFEQTLSSGKAGLQSLPGLTVEHNRALEQLEKTVHVLENAGQTQSDLRIITGEQARAVMMVGETPQVQRKALIPAFDQEKAEQMVSQAIKTRLPSLTTREQTQLVEEMAKEGKLETLRGDPRIILEIIAQKKVIEETVEAEIDPEVMENRLESLEKTADQMVQTQEEASGTELIEMMGPERRIEKSRPLQGSQLSDGGKDTAWARISQKGVMKVNRLYLEARDELLAHPAIRFVKRVTTRSATDREVHEVFFEQKDEIIKFAMRRGMVMLARLVPV